MQNQGNTLKAGLPDANSADGWQDQLQALLAKYLQDWQYLYKVLIDSGLVFQKSYGDGETICEFDGPPDAFWLITDGEVEILGPPPNNSRIKTRGPGEMIGEQAFLKNTQPGATPARQAGMRTSGNVHLTRFEGGILRKLDEDPMFRSSWFEFMAHMLNDKLSQATRERVDATDDQVDRTKLLRRFADESALAVVEMAVSGGVVQRPLRDTVIWFSDIVGFSAWSKGRDGDVIAAAAAHLMGIQADLIRQHGGEVDKFMGDGLMAFWFVDGVMPDEIAGALRCVIDVVPAFEKATAGTAYEGLTLRIGLHCGDTCFGDFGTPDRIAVTILGDPVNLAARYEQLRNSESNPNLGSIRLSDRLYERIIEVDAALVEGVQGPRTERVKDDEFIVYWIED